MSGVPMPNFLNIRTSLKRELNEFSNDDDDDDDICSITTNGDYSYQRLAKLGHSGVDYYNTDIPELIIEEEGEWDSDSSQASITAGEEERELNEKKLIVCQTWIRTWLARKRFNRLRQYYRSEPFLSILIRFQASVRGNRARKMLHLKQSNFSVHIDFIIQFQAACRSYLVQSRKGKIMHHYHTNIDKIIRAQRIVKTKFNNIAYLKLKTNVNPSVSEVKNFIHLLDNSDLDFDRELVIEALRQQVIESIKENNELDAHVMLLDLQIALFIKNVITFEEVLKQSGAFKKRKEQLMSKAIDKMNSPALEGPFSLSLTDKEGRERRALFEQLVYLLQTQPRYLTNLLSLLNRSGVCSQRLIESTVLSLFGYATNTREEYLMINLCKSCIDEEIKGIGNTQEFMLGNYIFMKLIVQINRGAKEREFFRTLLTPLINQAICNEFMDLDLDPMSIYQKIQNGKESRTGTPSNRLPPSSVKEALADSNVLDIFTTHVDNLKEIVGHFILTIISTVNDIPYGIRVIAKELWLVLKDSFPDESHDRILRVIGHFIYYRYLNPAIIAPEQYDVISAVVTPLQRRNLAEISKILQKISSGTFFEDEPHKTLFNDYIAEASKNFNDWFLTLIDVEDPETYFDMNELTDHIIPYKPTIHISPLELFHLHYILEKNLEDIEPEGSDILRTILYHLGPSPYHPEIELPESSICLTLSTKASLAPKDDLEARVQEMILDAKRLIVYVIKIQSGHDLNDIFNARVTEKQETVWKDSISKEFVEKDDFVASKRRYIILGNSKSKVDLAKITFYQLKEITRGLVDNLVRNNIIQGYQEIISMIARDITGQHSRRLQRNKELFSLKSTLNHLKEKHEYLIDQYNSYEHYLNGCMTAMVTKRGQRKHKLTLPFTRQYFHLRRLQRKGIMPKFGTYKYTAKQLYDRHILLHVEDVPKRFYDRISIILSMHEIGVITIEGNYSDWPMSTIQVNMRYEELLQTQYEGFQTMTVLDGLVEVNVNLLVYFINKKFYA
ncbi:Rho GTPase activation protein [Cokeromyces recurvatus]|uniref:Rho GTPase activation protein n=1 Tax=Cokeromyces recurvatus TaxID=90255 RepID=UPI00221F78F2|nr:Rho GTPase activation protein [Cokeromyces recurvatus]KAI7907194.1 Rho GTPase activation protein [Cokeromyces recurvatus]